MPKHNRAPDALSDLLLTRVEREYLDGLLTDLGTLPDGVWQAACCAVIASCGEFTGFDAHEVWLAWCIEHGEEQMRVARSVS